jgi:hypothetical protein
MTQELFKDVFEFKLGDGEFKQQNLDFIDNA